jgi:aminoglycoside phosphotransferase (APT) family kinase protein
VLEPREYSNRLGVIRPEQLQAALTRFGLGELLDAEPAPGGLFGQIVLLTTSTGGYALRGNPHAGQVQRERYVAELIHERTRVPAPWPYLVDESTDIFGWEYALMPRMPGVQLADGDVRGQLTPGDHLAIVVALAGCLAELHAARFEWPGVFDAATGGYAPAAKDFADWFGDWTRWWLERCRAASAATTDADAAWVEHVIADARDALAEPFVPCLVHTDFKENNAVAEKSADGWRISGVFDLADTHLGDGEYDLSRAYCEYVRRPALARAYVGTYFRLRPPRPGLRERMRHYILHDRLIIWEYAQRNGMWVRPGEPLRAWAEQFLELPELPATTQPS